MSSLITTQRLVDAPTALDARYRMDATDRRKIDDQILGCEQHLVDSLIAGKLATWFTLDGASAAVILGDTVALASGPSGNVTKTTAGVLTNAKVVAGIVVKAASAGGAVLVAVGGILPPTVTGLAAGAPGYVRVNTSTSRLERVSALSVGDHAMGAVDNAGYALILRQPSAAPIGGVVAMSTNDVDWSVGQSFTKTLAAGANAITFSNVIAGGNVTLRFTGAVSTVSFPAGTKWSGGVAPTQTSSGTDVYSFWSDGTSVYGSVVQNFS